MEVLLYLFIAFVVVPFCFILVMAFFYQLIFLIVKIKKYGFATLIKNAFNKAKKKIKSWWDFWVEDFKSAYENL